MLGCVYIRLAIARVLRILTVVELVGRELLAQIVVWTMACVDAEFTKTHISFQQVERISGVMLKIVMRMSSANIPKYKSLSRMSMFLTSRNRIHQRDSASRSIEILGRALCIPTPSPKWRQVNSGFLSGFGVSIGGREVQGVLPILFVCLSQWRDPQLFWTTTLRCALPSKTIHQHTDVKLYTRSLCS